MVRKTARKTLLDMSDDWVDEIRDAFLLAMADVTDVVVLKELIAAIEFGDIEKAFRVLGLGDAAMRPITAAIERAFENGGVAVGKTFPKRLATTDGVSGTFRFNVRDSRAEKWLREKSSSLVQTEIEHVRTSIRNVMTDGVTAGRNPKSVALDITGRVNRLTGKRQGGVIGLTSNQERWAANVRLDLETLDSRYFTRELRAKRFDDVVRVAIADGKPLPVETINKLTGAYKNNALSYRGKVIGRTEALTALRQSNREAYEQAVDMGAANKADMTRIWDATGDNKTRPDHLAAETDTRTNPVGFDEPFILADGSQLMFPGDISLGAPPEQTVQCRCIEQYVVDWTANLK